MVIDVVCAATSAQIRVESRIAGYQEVYPNSLPFDAAKKTLYAIGRTEEDIERESPEVWTRRQEFPGLDPIVAISLDSCGFINCTGNLAEL